MDEQGSEHVEELDLEPATVVRNRRPQVLWAVLAVVAVVAGALVVTSADDDGNPRPGLPVDLASHSGAQAAAADSSMRAWVTYVPGDDLPALGGEATAYRLRGEVHEADVRALADALGLEGAVETDGTASWWVAGEGGLGRLDVRAGSGASWSYYPGGDCVTEAGGVVACAAGGSSSSSSSSGSGTSTACDGSTPECTVTTAIPPDACIEASDDVAVDCAARPNTAATTPCPPGADCVILEACSQPDVTSSTCPDDTATTAPPVPLTGEDEARAAALDVVAATGADVDGARVTTQSGGESRTWFVTVEPLVDGIPTGLVSYVEVSEGAVVTSGNGFFGQPEPLGEYPLLDTRAVIDRANTQSEIGIGPARGAADDAVAGTTADDDGGTAVGSTIGGDQPTTTVVTGSEPCASAEGAADDCGGTVCFDTDCNDVGAAEEPPTTVPCKVQSDGREICEPVCPQTATTEDAVAPDVTAVGAPESVDCAPPHPTPGEPVPDPMPQPLELVLIDAEPSLVLLPANDGSADAYLVPAYRFTAEDGSTVDLPAVADEALTGPVTTETTVPGTAVTEPAPVPEPQPCEVLTEQDPGTETTHTVQTCTTPDPEPGTLPKGEQPAIGVGYYVDIDFECTGFVLGDQVWVSDDGAVADWERPGERWEGGTFTLDAEDHGTFVGDAAATKVAQFRTLGPAEDIFCSPEPRG